LSDIPLRASQRNVTHAFFCLAFNNASFSIRYLSQSLSYQSLHTPLMSAFCLLNVLSLSACTTSSTLSFYNAVQHLQISYNQSISQIDKSPSCAAGLAPRRKHQSGRCGLLLHVDRPMVRDGVTAKVAYRKPIGKQMRIRFPAISHAAHGLHTQRSTRWHTESGNGNARLILRCCCALTHFTAQSAHPTSPHIVILRSIIDHRHRLSHTTQ